MSEGVSTATKTINTQLTSEGSFFATTPNELTSWMSVNLKILFTLCLLCFICSIVMSFVNAVKGASEVQEIQEIEQQKIMFVPPQMRMGCPCGGRCPCHMKRCPCRRCRMMESGMIEQFSNDELYSYKQSQQADYQSIPLLPKDNGQHLLFGQANRYIHSKDSVNYYILELYCNLYILEGNVYDKTPRHTTKQAYKVYLLSDKDKKKMHLGDLQKDGDGIYKLKMKTDKVQEFIKYNKIVIVYSLNNNEQVMLQGDFK